MSKQYDISEIAGLLAGRAEAVCQWLLPQGKREGRDLECLAFHECVLPYRMQMFSVVECSVHNTRYFVYIFNKIFVIKEYFTIAHKRAAND